MTGYAYALGALATVSGEDTGTAEYTGRVRAPDRTLTEVEPLAGSGGEWSFSVVLDQPGTWTWVVRDEYGQTVEEGSLYCSASDFDLENDGS